MADERTPETPFVRRRDLRAQREAEARLAALETSGGEPVDALSAPIEQVEEGAGYTPVSPPAPVPAPTSAVPPAHAPEALVQPTSSPETAALPTTGPATGGLRRRDLRAQSMPMSFGGGAASALESPIEAPAPAGTAVPAEATVATEVPTPAPVPPAAVPAPPAHEPAAAAPEVSSTEAWSAAAPSHEAWDHTSASPVAAQLPEPQLLGASAAGASGTAGAEHTGGEEFVEAPSGVLADHELPPEPVPASRPLTRREIAEIPEPKDYGRAGRNLPAAIGVGLAVGLSILAVLIYYPPAFIAIAVLGIVGALWELSSALSRSGARVARIPTMTAGACMALATALAGREALWVAFAIGAGAILLWTLFERRPNAVKDVSLGIFALTYVGLMASFIVHMITLDRGNLLVITFLAVVIASDVGGYAFGVLWGKHPIAPRISPKKSWEGFAGSVLVGSGIGVTLSILVMDAPWWCGIVLGIVIPAVATLGDFSESMIKRDLDLKDMGTLLPGHGGVMDRLDSILPTAPVALALFTVLPGFIS